MQKIVVTGGTGRLGSAVVEQLGRRSPSSLLAVSVRYPKAARRWSEQGIAVRHGDFDIPETLPEAFAGAERLLIVSTSADNITRARQHRNAIDAARGAGVRRIYYTSIIQRTGSVFLPTEGHLQTEADLAQAEVPVTILRNGQYMENLPLFLGLGLEGDTIALPADGPTAWVALEDLAEGIARVLTEPDDGAGQPMRSLTLTGPIAIDFADIARFASATFGRLIERKVIDGRAFEEKVAETGMSPALARVLESGFRSRAAGELAAVDPTLRRILGRDLRTVEGELPRLLQQMASREDGWLTIQQQSAVDSQPA